ncbi:MAG TPA: hypothetical protein VGN37_08390 [Actinocatenispora sp.]
MTLSRARSSAEAHLYMRMQPCEVCGATEFFPDSSVVMVDGELASRYTGLCPQCGTTREFTFLLPDEVIFPNEEEPEFGDDQPSELLDPGEWLWLADASAGAAPASPDGLSDQARRDALVDLRTAAAAVDEVLKFIPDGAEEVPSEAFRSPRGRAVYAQEPGRFRRGRLAAVRATYREISDRFVS